MATLIKRKNGIFACRFQCPETGKRRMMTCATVNKSQATRTVLQVGLLVTAREFGHPLEAETVKWLSTVSEKVRTKLEEFGLIGDGQAGKPATLEAHLDDYFQRRRDIKPSTRTVWGHVRRNLLSFFGGDRLLSSINIGNANDFATFLKTEARQNRYGEREAGDALSTSTLRKRLQICKQIFADALDHRLITENPFRRFKTATPANRSKDFFVTDEMSAKILAACPDSTWKLLYVLCRYQALRCPSEVLSLRWEHVLWDKRQLVVFSPKLAHHGDDKAYRVQPIFPQTMPFLEAAFHEAPDGSEFVIEKYRDGSVNLRTQFAKICARAGVPMWEKPFINLRASRISELCNTFPSHVICDWAGHSERISQAHYCQTLPEHFEQAVNAPLPAEMHQICCSQSPTEPDTTRQPNKKAPESQGLASAVGCGQADGWSLLDSNQ